MENFNISNKKTGVRVDINEYLFLKLLKIIRLRDKGLYNILKKKYEQLTQKEFNEEVFHINNR